MPAAAIVNVNCNDKMTISKAICFLNTVQPNTICLIGVCYGDVTIQCFTQAAVPLVLVD